MDVSMAIALTSLGVSASSARRHQHGAFHESLVERDHAARTTLPNGRPSIR